MTLVVRSLRYPTLLLLLTSAGCSGERGGAGADRPPEDSALMDAPRTAPATEPMDTTGHSGRGTTTRDPDN